MPVLPIIFIFISFWPSDAREVVVVEAQYVDYCKVRPEDCENVFYSEEDNCYYYACIVDQETMEYARYCKQKQTEEKKSSEKKD